MGISPLIPASCGASGLRDHLVGQLFTDEESVPGMVAAPSIWLSVQIYFSPTKAPTHEAPVARIKDFCTARAIALICGVFSKLKAQLRLTVDIPPARAT